MDLMKFILAAFVAAIHVRPFSGEAAFLLDDCIAQIADPLFFCFTSYFLFSKIIKMGWSAGPLGAYLKRIGILYGIWVLLYFPRILQLCLPKGGWTYLLKKILLAGPYGALWFLTALLLAVPLTFFIGRRWGGRGCMAAAFPFYLFTTVMTMYGRWGGSVPLLDQIRAALEQWFEWLANGLTYGFFFCAMGLRLAEQTAEQKEKSSVSPLLLPLVLGLRILECYIARESGAAFSYGAGLSQILCAWVITKMLIGRGERANASARRKKVCYFLSKMSILIFVLHYGIMELFGYFWRNVRYYRNNTTVQYLWVFGVSCAMAAALIRASEKPALRFLKRLY